MMTLIPEDRSHQTPQWWDSERYDYCDVIVKEHAGNLINRLFKKFTHLFA